MPVETVRYTKEWLEAQHYFGSTDQLLREVVLQLIDLNEKLDLVNVNQRCDADLSLRKLFGLKK